MVTMDFLIEINELQTHCVEEWHTTTPDDFDESFLGLVGQQHWQNFQLWHEEDTARAPDVSDTIIATVKRNIDGFNQRRNDLIEILDDHLLNFLAQNNHIMAEDAPLNSETPGSMIDRCSIMSLKIFHMNEQANRDDADQEHKQKALDKVGVLKEQRKDLLQCLSDLLKDAQLGTRQFKIYRQFKMYNDPTLNPKIYSANK
ncbi:MAG: hypothetical protein ACI86H_000635 [bacterium]|jgi:hypothetical protein